MSATPQQKKKNIIIKRRAGGETLIFSSDIGVVRIAIGNWYDESIKSKLNNMIYLFRIDIYPRFRGQGNCVKLLTHSLLEAKNYLITTSYYNHDQPFNGMVDIETREEYFQRAYNCYLRSYNNIGFELTGITDVVRVAMKDDKNNEISIITQKLMFSAPAISYGNYSSSSSPPKKKIRPRNKKKKTII